EGTVLEWKKRDGEEVHKGDVLAEIESDKASFDIEAEADGVLHVVVGSGQSVPVGQLIGRIGGEAPAAPAPAATPPAATPPPAARPPPPRHPPSRPPRKPPDHRQPPGPSLSRRRCQRRRPAPRPIRPSAPHRATAPVVSKPPPSPAVWPRRWVSTCRRSRAA